ncbi:MAG: SPOR domain-containing protein, partial [Desulfobulbaceae bacterium]|nr:SPOR domain-containing protein [Desulfobulbaceae bacterium]
DVNGEHEEPEPEELAPDAAASAAKATDAVKEESGASDATCFSLQVGAFRETANAKEAVAEWKGKGYEAFSLPPREGSSLTRVFVGRFDDLADANKLVADLEEKEKLRAYITLIPVADK